MISDRVYRWRLILGEYGPDIVYTKGIHNTVAESTSLLDFHPDFIKIKECHYLSKLGYTEMQIEHLYWKTFTTTIVNYYNISIIEHIDMSNYINNVLNTVFANCSEENEIFPITVTYIAQASHK